MMRVIALRLAAARDPATNPTEKCHAPTAMAAPIAIQADV